jgi:hypothetical protein
MAPEWRSGQIYDWAKKLIAYHLQQGINNQSVRRTFY